MEARGCKGGKQITSKAVGDKGWSPHENTVASDRAVGLDDPLVGSVEMSVIPEKPADRELGEEADKDSRNQSQLGLGGGFPEPYPHFTLNILATTSDRN